MEQETLSSYLKRLRSLRDMSPEQLAIACRGEPSASAIRSVERGGTRSPKPETLRNLARALGGTDVDGVYERLMQLAGHHVVGSQRTETDLSEQERELLQLFRRQAVEAQDAVITLLRRTGAGSLDTGDSERVASENQNKDSNSETIERADGRLEAEGDSDAEIERISREPVNGHA